MSNSKKLVIDQQVVHDENDTDQSTFNSGIFYSNSYIFNKFVVRRLTRFRFQSDTTTYYYIYAIFFFFFLPSNNNCAQAPRVARIFLSLVIFSVVICRVAHTYPSRDHVLLPYNRERDRRVLGVLKYSGDFFPV